ncbi:MAG: ferrous iron transport protein B [Actinomycetota bacterium]|nr:ferrous iron transport protein B [Actinomycetota bacterium]
MSVTVAIAGAPNSGKTTLFNQLAGVREHVGNWPGQTVERVAGRFEARDEEFTVVDLPGTYGLVAVSAEEAISTRFLIEERPDVVVSVCDASNLAGSLHLVAQIAEAGFRQVVALNMSDVAERRGIDIDDALLARELGATVVPTVARKGTGVDELAEAIAAAASEVTSPQQLILDYGAVVERHIGGLSSTITECDAASHFGPARWSAVQMLAGDQVLLRSFETKPCGPRMVAEVTRARSEITSEVGFDVEMVLAERRFAWITHLVDTVTGSPEPRTFLSDRLDLILTNRWLGLPIFFAVMWIVLRFTADVTAPYLDWIDATISGPVSRWAVVLLGAIGIGGGWFESLIVDGVLAGVGGVLVFVPVLFGLYLMLAILEDSGYMARAAAVADRTMRAVGIPGKSFLPMMVGFGCTVPAIYATRTLDSPRDRLLTGLITPFMSCGARLPVYVLLASVFFVGSSGTVVFSMYLLGISVAVLVGFVLSKTALKEEEPSPFVMVMPEFRAPSARTIWALASQRTGAFIKGAGTLIVAASIVVWALLAIPVGGDGTLGDTEPENSAFGVVAETSATVLEPLGFGEWEQSGALISGFVAKEVVVSTMAQLYSVEDRQVEAETGSFLSDVGEIATSFVTATFDTIRAIPSVIGIDFLDIDVESSTGFHNAIRSSFDASSGGHGSLAALAFMVFVLLYTPCVASVAAFRHEFGTKWMTVSITGQMVIAWVFAFLVFQGGLLLGVG